MSFAHLDAVLEEVGPLGELFAQADYRLFLVGGIVRDQWLGEPLDTSSDIDLTTNALPAEIKRIVAPLADDLWTQGEKFGTIGLRSRGRDYEITTHRAENYTTDSRKPQVSFGDDIKTDLSRRDFTVNAMAIELPDGELVDPYGGAADLAARRLDTPLSAGVSFTDDPLRMLRAARFSAKLSLTITDDVVASATVLHERLRIVAIERIGVEMRRLLGLDQAKVGLSFLADTALLAEVLSYGEPALIDGVQPRLSRAICVADKLPSDWQLRLAAIGIAVFDTVQGVQLLCERLRLSRDNERRIVGLSSAAIDILSATELSDEAIRRWIDGCQDRAGALELATVLTEKPDHVAAFDRAVQQLLAREAHVPRAAMDGDAIMKLLGVTPGPVIGQAQKFLQDSYFATGPLSSSSQEALLVAWWADQPNEPSR